MATLTWKLSNLQPLRGTQLSRNFVLHFQVTKMIMEIEANIKYECATARSPLKHTPKSRFFTYDSSWWCYWYRYFLLVAAKPYGLQVLPKSWLNGQLQVLWYIVCSWLLVNWLLFSLFLVGLPPMRPGSLMKFSVLQLITTTWYSG